MILIAGILVFISSLGVSNSYKIDEIKESRDEIQRRRRKFSYKRMDISQARNRKLHRADNRLRNYKRKAGRTTGFARHLWRQPIRRARRHRDNLQKDQTSLKEIERFNYKIVNHSRRARIKNQQIDNQRRRLNRLRK